MNVCNRFFELFFQTCTLDRNTSCFIGIAVHRKLYALLHFTKHHFRMLLKILVYRNSVLCLTEAYPIRLDVKHFITLLKKDNVRGYFRSCVIFKSIVRQSYCSEKFGSLSKILSELRICLVKRTL